MPKLFFSNIKTCNKLRGRTRTTMSERIKSYSKMCCLCDECDGLNENSKLTEIWLLFRKSRRKQIMILNLHTDLNQAKKRKKENCKFPDKCWRINKRRMRRTSKKRYYEAILHVCLVVQSFFSSAIKLVYCTCTRPNHEMKWSFFLSSIQLM